MKGFKKDGKFIPTGNKKKSALKKDDILTDKFGRRSDSKIKKTTWKEGEWTNVKYDYFGKGDPKYDERARKGYKPKSLLQKMKLRNKQSLDNQKPYTPQPNDNTTPEEFEKALDRAVQSLKDRRKNNGVAPSTEGDLEDYKNSWRFGIIDYMNFYDDTVFDHKTNTTKQAVNLSFQELPKGSTEDEYIEYMDTHFPFTDLESLHTDTNYAQDEAQYKYTETMKGNAPIPRSEFTKDDVLASNWWSSKSEQGGAMDFGDILGLEGNQFGSTDVSINVGDFVPYDYLSKQDQVKIKARAKELFKDGQIDREGYDKDW